MSRLFVVCLLMATAATAFAQTRQQLNHIRLPDGFAIEVLTDDVPNARSLALGDNGTIFVSTRRGGEVFAVRILADGETEVLTLADGLRNPNGIAFFAGDLYVAETKRLLRFADIENQLDSPPSAEVLNEDFPGERHHGWRFIEFGPNGKLYMSIGAPCNVCDREGYGIIQRMNPDGSDRETVAFGVRNSVGLTFHPDTDELWFTDNGRDMLGDDLPAGELNRLAQVGSHYGFPFCHGGDVPDPEFGGARSCAEFVKPEQKLGPHVAPLGFEIYSGEMFPEHYRGQAFIAEHGSWNRSKKIGYRISLARLTGPGAPTYEMFAEGWLSGEQVSGRPVDVLQLADGSLVVSDDQAGRLYRIYYAAPLLGGLDNGRRLARPVRR